VLSDGIVERAPDLDAVRADLVAGEGEAAIRAVAIVFMHAYRYPEHERIVAEIAREIGFPQVSVSHEVSPLVKLVGRGDTTVVDAYLSPILARYVAQVSEELDVARTGARLMFMMSSGGLTAADLFQGKDAILSGPAGGVVGLARPGAPRVRARHRLRHGRHLDGRRALRRRIRARLRDGGRGRAHARADDADPHGRRGRRLDPALRRRALSRRPGFRRRQSRPRLLPARRAAHRDRRQRHGRQAPAGLFPKIFGPIRTSRSTPTACARSLRGSRGASATARSRGGRRRLPRIAVANMAEAIKKISVQRGYDVTRYALNCFGGAGGQHACLVADALGMKTVLIHPLSGLLSAYGMGLADIRATRQAALDGGLDAVRRGPSSSRAPARGEAMAELTGQGVAREDIVIECARISATPARTPRFPSRPRAARGRRSRHALGHRSRGHARGFEEAHKRRFGFIDETKPLVIEAGRVEAIGGGRAVRRGGGRGDREAIARVRQRDALLLGRVARGQRLSARAISSAASGFPAPPSSSSPTRPSSSSPAGRRG
jgi:5-oxoprolinase (ATP-hydrolysing)